jgi:ornithine--oxo-acid transaminase
MTVTQDSSRLGADFIELDETWSTHNYHPLPVVISSAEGAWVTDVDGKRYLDFLSGYSALNFGHRHPALVAAAVEQLGGDPARSLQPVERAPGEADRVRPLVAADRPR